MARNTVSRSLHDVGLAAWFGGTLANAVALNPASGQASSPSDRGQVANTGWDRWTPVNAAAIALHLAGSIGQLSGNKSRLASQSGVGTMAIVKTGVTAAALGVTGVQPGAGKEGLKPHRRPRRRCHHPHSSDPARGRGRAETARCTAMGNPSPHRRLGCHLLIRGGTATPSHRPTQPVQALNPTTQRPPPLPRRLFECWASSSHIGKPTGNRPMMQRRAKRGQSRPGVLWRCCRPSS